MNAPLHPSVEARTPYRFSYDELLRIVQAGLLEDDRVELIEGELILMGWEALPHMRVKRWLTAYFIRALPAGVFEVQPESPLKLTRFSAPQPDLYIFPSSVAEETMTGADACLVVEVAVTSLMNDLRRKAVIYARYGVPEYWVIDADRRELWVHRDPQGDRYAAVATLGPDERITPLRLPDLSFGLCDLPG